MRLGNDSQWLLVILFLLPVALSQELASFEHIDVEPLYVQEGIFTNSEVTADEAELSQNVFSSAAMSTLLKLKEWLANHTSSLAERIQLLEDAQEELLKTAARDEPEPQIEETTTSTDTATTTEPLTSQQSKIRKTSIEAPKFYKITHNDNNQLTGRDLEDFISLVPESFLGVPEASTFGVQLKSGNYEQKHGPPISVFGSGNFKTMFLVENIVKGRAVYTAALKPTPEQQANNKIAMLNFYEKPIHNFERKIYICKLTDVVSRWAVLGKPCDPNRNQFFGYEGYVAKFNFIDTSGYHPVIAGKVASNREVGMPFGTRFWNEAMPAEGNVICCNTGPEFQGFVPCCHYRWYPWAFKMPAGWGQWNAWGECKNGKRIRTRPCNGMKGQCKAFFKESHSPTPWKDTESCLGGWPNDTSARLLGPIAETTKKSRTTTTKKTTTTTRRTTTTTRKPTTTKVVTTKPRQSAKYTIKTTQKPYTTMAWNRPGWSPWSSWTKCSRSCGGGIQFRERVCSKNCPNYRGWHQEPRNCGMVLCPPGERSRWGVWTEWGACDRSCGMGFKLRYISCDAGYCKSEDPATYPKQRTPCYDKQWCSHWADWAEWSPCSALCSGGTKTRTRKCNGAVPGLEGCTGSQYDKTKCNTSTCQGNQRRYTSANQYGMPRQYQEDHRLSPFEQECIDFHNFFRALHNLKPLEWRSDITATAKSWANQLRYRAQKGPGSVTGKRTKHWPHSDSPSEFRAKNVGENIAWDLTENGHPCKESVYRWYAELFYFNPKKPTKGRRGNEPVGHLTQLLWPDTTHIGCATISANIRQPPNTVPEYLKSTYTVCHYAPQGNIIGQHEEKWADLDKSYCSTYDNYKGSNKCTNAGFSNCMGLTKQSKCGCDQVTKKKFSSKIVKRLFQENAHKKLKHTEIPLCTGTCLIYCENKWGTRNYWPHECIGKTKCTCGIDGAVCE